MVKTLWRTGAIAGYTGTPTSRGVNYLNIVWESCCSRWRVKLETLLANSSIFFSFFCFCVVVFFRYFSDPPRLFSILFLSPPPQELTRPRCYDGAYARGLWAAGFSFYTVTGAAVFSSAKRGIKGCRQGGHLPLESYSSFLQVKHVGVPLFTTPPCRFTRATPFGQCQFAHRLGPNPTPTLTLTLPPVV